MHRYVPKTDKGNAGLWEEAVRGSFGCYGDLADQLCRIVPWTEVEYMTKTNAMLGAEAKQKT